METQTELLSLLREFADGNTLVLLYLSVSFVRHIILPLHKSSKNLSALLDAATQAMATSASAHGAIAVELKALRKVLEKA